MQTLANTPEPPYYAVIFSSVLKGSDPDYDKTAARMEELAAVQDGYLGLESARSGIGISVSYWKDEASIRAWKAHAEHIIAQETGKHKWYASYRTRVARVERAYGFDGADQ